jgi:hypothetical protein
MGNGQTDTLQPPVLTHRSPGPMQLKTKMQAKKTWIKQN